MKKNICKKLIWIPAFVGMTSFAGMTAVSAEKKGSALDGFSTSKVGMKQENSSKANISIYLDSEGQVTKNKIDKNNQGFYPFLPYTELGLSYSGTGKTNFFLGLSAEQENHQWAIGLEEVRLSHTFTKIPFQIDIGYLPLPLGYREQNKFLFSREFSFYQVLKTKTEDIAVIANLQIWKPFLNQTGSEKGAASVIVPSYNKDLKHENSNKTSITVQAGIFGGWSYRSSDKLYKPPDSLPFIISLKSQGPFWSAFASWFQKDPAFSGPLRAVGGGLHLNHSDKTISLSFQSAIWHIQEQGQSSIVFYTLPSLTLYTVTAGLAFSSMNRFFPNFRQADVQSALYDKAFHVAWQAHPNIKLIGERWISGQEKGPLTDDLWAFRVKIHFDFSAL